MKSRISHLGARFRAHVVHVKDFRRVGDNGADRGYHLVHKLIRGHI